MISLRRAPESIIGVLLLAGACGSPANDTAKRAQGDAPPAREALPRPVTDTLWLLAASPAGDAIHETDDEAALIRRFGAENVRRDSVSIGEGFSELGTLVFPADPSRRLEVLWKDPVRFSRPSSVKVSGAATRWHVWPGITLGTTLETIEQLNGRAFALTGLGTHYDGTVVDWNGGRLAPLLERAGPDRDRVTIRMQADREPAAGIDTRHLSGEGAKSSSDTAMRAIRPRVYEIVVVPR